MTRRTWTCATCRIEHTCTSVFVQFIHHTTWLKAARTCHSLHPHAIHVQCSLSCFSFSFYFLLFLFFFSFLMTDGDSMTINNLRDSANGTFVHPGRLPSTSQVMSPTPWSSPMPRSSTTRSPATSSTSRIPSSAQPLRQTSTWMTTRSASYSQKYTEITPITAVPKGVSVSPSSMSVMVDRTGKLVAKSDIDQFVFSVRNMYSAQNQCPVITQTERMVDRTVKTFGRNHWNC